MHRFIHWNHETRKQNEDNATKKVTFLLPLLLPFVACVPRPYRALAPAVELIVYTRDCEHILYVLRECDAHAAATHHFSFAVFWAHFSEFISCDRHRTRFTSDCQRNSVPDSSSTISVFAGGYEPFTSGSVVIRRLCFTCTRRTQRVDLHRQLLFAEQFHVRATTHRIRAIEWLRELFSFF